MANNPINLIDLEGLEFISAEEGRNIASVAALWINVIRREGAGGTSSRASGVDCSGLVWLVYNEAGYPYEYAKVSSFVQKEEFGKINDLPRPGDVIIYPGHMGIYSLEGKIIHASLTMQKVYKDNIFPGVVAYYRYKITCDENEKR